MAAFMITMSEPYGRRGKPQMIHYLPTFFLSFIPLSIISSLAERRGVLMCGFLPLLGRNTDTGTYR